MAKIKQKRIENIDGDFYVDKTCIDCGTCYWMAPNTFKNEAGMSCVHAQPDDADSIKAMQALFSCPTNSIGYVGKNTKLNKLAHTFPIPVEDNVFHNGFHSESSFGAASYFITREQGNILVDGPRYSKSLSKNMKNHGGVKLHYLTHKDDVADTDLYQKDFNSTRLMHSDDISTKTNHYETQLTGEDDYKIDDDLLVIPVPGHTKGHTVLLYKEKFLFTGDHLALSKNLGHLYAFKTACWYDFDTQIKSMEKLLNYQFLYILPGHGAPFRATSYQEMHGQLKKCIEWMKS